MDNDYAPEVIYLTSSRSSDGYSHPLCYPQHQPGIMYSPHADSNGWYPHLYSYGNPSYHSPSLPVPPTPLPVPPPPPLPLPPAVPQIPTEEVTSASSFTDILQLDEFWRGRLAPLPGYQSRPGLVPVKETKRIQIGVPTEIKQESSRLHSSFFAKEYQKPTFNNPDTEVSSSLTHHSP
jgi:hypothetical protein